MLTSPTMARPTAPPRQRRPGRTVFLGLGASLTFGLLCCAWHVRQHGQLPLFHRENVWSVAIYEGTSPFALQPTNHQNAPVLTAADVNDAAARFVADPFMVPFRGRWFMFLEVFNQTTRQGDIGLATSDDGLHWEYERIVLDESFHLSYPSVFSWQDRWYMLPETSQTDSVRLYEASEFPGKWRFVQTLLTTAQPADPTLFRHDDMWWMFVGRAATHHQLRLYYADDLRGPWSEHPRSPLIEDNANVARPAGSVIRCAGQLYRCGQDCLPKYGNQLRVFRITQLTRTDYAERPVAENPALAAGSHAWNSHGMHHLDAHQMADGSWRAAVDGHRKTWSLRLIP